jgi:hypothetical protein
MAARFRIESPGRGSRKRIWELWAGELRTTNFANRVLTGPGRAGYKVLLRRWFITRSL